ncbi:MAG: hypothetical protein LUG54_01335 [Clostridiales bacterium]|nr:hypothetical protein [Clostridiales bacterium]
MSNLSLNAILVDDCRIEYRFNYDNDLKKYFTEKPFVIEFPESIIHVPYGVLAIPFVVNVLPIIWLKNAKLIIPELDKNFYECIPEIKQGYINMYPEAVWNGEISVKKVIDCEKEMSENKSALFFSGGLDATTTVMRHFTENPEAYVIWGSDIKYANTVGWSKMHRGLLETVKYYDMNLSVIHSSFREFLNEGMLHSEFFDVLKDGWWHGVQHGIGILGHAAPLSWLHNIHCFYIASSNCPADGKVRCASHPTIDNHVRFCGCRIIHDGYELSRQDKIAYVVKRQEELHVNVFLHVCWESDSGTNCCHCEKCYRTMVGLWAEGVEPYGYGFLYDEKNI